MSKQFLRKQGVADRYGVHPRTVERMTEDGRLPQPIYHGKFPLWDTDALDASDRVAALAARPKTTEAA